jgi:hypothetical protein
MGFKGYWIQEAKVGIVHQIQRCRISRLKRATTFVHHANIGGAGVIMLTGVHSAAELAG